MLDPEVTLILRDNRNRAYEELTHPEIVKADRLYSVYKDFDHERLERDYKSNLNKVNGAAVHRVLLDRDALFIYDDSNFDIDSIQPNSSKWYIMAPWNDKGPTIDDWVH